MMTYPVEEKNGKFSLFYFSAAKQIGRKPVCKSVVPAECQVKGADAAKCMHKLIDKSVTQTCAWPCTMTDSLATGT